MPTSLWQNGGEGHGSFGEDPYQLLGKGLEADHDQLFVVVAVTGAVICPDMHDDVHRQRETETETERQRETERDRQTDRHRHRHRQTDRQRQRDRDIIFVNVTVFFYRVKPE